MTEPSAAASLLEAVERYFTLMYDNDISHFDQVFAPSAQLHGFRNAELRILTAQDYKGMLVSSASAKSKNAPRLQEMLLIDFASSSQAVVKVRVRVDAIQYLDYLSYHRIEGAWLITAKSFHVEQRFEASGA